MGDYKFTNKIVVTYETMKEWITNLYVAVGMRENDASICADTIVMADMRGVYSHGAMRAPIYAKRMHEGGTSSTSQPDIVMDFNATAIIDGHNAMGQLVAYHAMELAIKKAKEFGIGCVAARGSNHCGMLSYFPDMAQRENTIGFAYTIGSANIMAPWGGLDIRLGNNPFSISIPANTEYPILLDMANSTVARGKILMAAKTNATIPESWALDVNGNPTTDPNEGLKGTARPVGDYKGYGMAYIVGLLSSMLSQAAFGDEILDLYAGLGKPQNLGHMMMAIDISRFDDIDHFKSKIDDSVKYVKSSRKKEGCQIYVPGEIEYLKAKAQLEGGIEYPVEVIKDMIDISEQFHVESLVRI